jgi:glycosyltransferase involved in cell wall biosynthesis
LSFWPIDVEKLGCVGVDPPRGRPLRIAHAPNHPHFKGTRYLVDAVERLRSEGVAIELVTVTGVPNSEVIRIFGEADVIADQFIIGMYGYTALEGMARGKAVLCHIAVPEWLVAQEECPLIRCRADTLYDVLRELASNPGRLEEIGRQGRRYIEKHHSLDAVAARLGRLYLETADLAPAIRARLGGRVAELEEKLARLPGTSRDAESRTPGSGAHLARAVSNA